MRVRAVAVSSDAASVSRSVAWSPLGGSPLLSSAIAGDRRCLSAVRRHLNVLNRDLLLNAVQLQKHRYKEVS